MNLSFNQRLGEVCRKKNNYLCIGLDLTPDMFTNNATIDLNKMEVKVAGIKVETLGYVAVGLGGVIVLVYYISKNRK